MGIMITYINEAKKELYNAFIRPSRLGMYYLKRALMIAEKGYPPYFEPQNHFKNNIWEKIETGKMEYPKYFYALNNNMIKESWIEKQKDMYTDI